MNARQYIYRMLFFGLTASLMVVLLNFMVDPYAITGAARVDGFNHYKADINDRVRLSKRYQASHGQFNAMLLGNSRVELGIDPSHSCLRQLGFSAYNMGIPGASVRKQIEYAMNLIHQQAITRVWMSVDFTDFLDTPGERAAVNSLPQLHEGDLEFLPNGERNPGFREVWLLDYYKSLYSLDSLISSLKTVLSQRESAADRDERGFNPARDFAHSVRLEGPRVLFDQKMQVLRAKYAKEWVMQNEDDGPGGGFEDLSAFLQLAQNAGVRVEIFTNPFHREFWNMLEQNGKMPLYREWQRKLRDLLADEGVTLWDFSADSIYISEAVPERGARSGPLQWFWEPAHYRRELGDRMMNTMLAEECKTPREAGFAGFVRY